MTLAELLALVEKTRALQRKPSVQRTFLDGRVKASLEAYEADLDRAVAEWHRQQESGGEEQQR